MRRYAHLILGKQRSIISVGRPYFLNSNFKKQENEKQTLCTIRAKSNENTKEFLFISVAMLQSE